MVMTFRYSIARRPSQYSAIRAPCIPVTLSGPAGSIRMIGLLDSGADTTFMPLHVAEYLGLDITKRAEDIGGIGGSMKAIRSSVLLRLKQGHEQYSIRLPVFVATGALADAFPLLIGRAGFFQRFKITFCESEGKVTLKHHLTDRIL